MAGAAVAGPAVIATRPIPEADSADLSFFLGGINEGGRSLKASRLELVIDGERTGVSPVTQSLADWATVSAEESKTWHPPLTVGLVYLWVEGVPPGVLDGIQGFFRRVPSRTPLYPTIYGRMRQDRARLTASEVSRLAEEVPYLEGYRPNLIEAIRLDLQEVASDSASLKVLLVVTDGRDFADPKGDGPGDFAALGREIRKAGVTLLVVAFPPPEADAVQATANMRDLQESAGGFLRALDQVQDIDNTLESLGQAVADLQRVRFTPPWTWRVLGGTHRLSVRLTTSEGQQLTADMGGVVTGVGRPWWILIVAVVILIVAIVVLVRRFAGGGSDARSSSSSAGDDDDEALLLAAHDLIRRGVSPKRAVDELSRSHPESVAALGDIAPETFSDPRFPYFRTRLGRLRMQEISDILTKKSANRPVLAPMLAQVLAEAVTGGMSPEKAAEAISGRVAADEWTAFAGLNFDQLAEALRASAGGHSILGTPRARGISVDIQDALRSGGGARGFVVGWLVRAGGPGTRGETLRLGDGATLLGQGPTCQLRILGDPAVAAEHAEFSVTAGEFSVTPREGAVSVEGAPVNGRHTLADGETLAVGGGLFVFKSASAGNLAKVATMAPRPARASRGRRTR